MEVICLEDDAFYVLVERVIEFVKKTNNVKGDKWLNIAEAMRRLKIKSKSTLQKLRDEVCIKFACPEKKWIVYDIDSINEYLNKNASKL